MRAVAAAIAIFGLAGCASYDAADEVDAGPGDDQPPEPSCEIAIDQLDPSEPESGDVVVARAEISADYGLSGIERYAWRVERAGRVVEIAPRDESGEAIEFETDEAGIYEIAVDGEVGTDDCGSADRIANIPHPEALRETLTLRVLPDGGESAAEIEFDLPGGADYHLGGLSIDPRTSLSGHVVGPEGPLAGYVRVRDAGGGEVEGFADASGELRAPRPPGGAPYELLVVPEDEDVAPARLEGVSEADLDELAIEPGVGVEGKVLSAEDEPVSGAEVSLSIEGVPSTIAETDGDGEFELRARPGEGSLRALAPAESGHYDLEADGIEVEGSQPLEIRYQEGADAVTVSPTVTEPGTDAPVAGASIRWVAESAPGAAEVVDGAGTRAAAGVLRREVRTDDEGVSPPLTLPATAYEVVVAGGDGESAGPARIPVDLEAEGAPAELSLAEPATLVGAVLPGAEGGGVDGARLLATPDGPLARAAAGSATARAGEGGEFSLEVAGDTAYELSIQPPIGAGLGSLRAQAEAPAPGEANDLGELELPEAVAVYGSLSALGAGALAGAHVSLFCVDCPEERARSPLAEATTDGAGRFRLVAPDPGVE